MAPAREVDTPGDDLVIEAGRSASHRPEQVSPEPSFDEATARRINQAVEEYVEGLAHLDPGSPNFVEKVSAIGRMGNDEMRRSAAASSHFLERPTTALKEGPLSQGSEVSTALLSLRRQVDDLDPSRHLGHKRGLFKRAPMGQQVENYFRKYQSAQKHIEAIVEGLYRGQDELVRDNAAIEQEKAHLWTLKKRLEQYAFMAATLDGALEKKALELERVDPEKARAFREDALFYVRQKHQDLLTQLAVTVQGYLALDLIRKNNVELVKGVERATTTTVSALRTAVIAALALGNQKLVLDQIGALNGTTSAVIQSTSEMLRQQSAEIQNQASSATVSVEKIQAAFKNIYETIDSIDAFKLAAITSMQQTIDALSGEVARARTAMDRAHTADLAQTRALSLVNDLALPTQEQET